MRWRKERKSENVEDRRGLKVPGGAKGVGLGAIVIGLIAIIFGADPKMLMGLLEQSQVGAQASSRESTGAEVDPNDEMSQFISAVLGSTEDVWIQLFQQADRRYEPPKLVLFSDQVQSACGAQSAAVGPFYCPGDNQVYLDTSFFDDLASRHNAPGDFAQAYVIAHEVGHHIQNILGISNQVHQQRARASEKESNQLSVRLELQADYLAGVWGHHAHRMRGILEPGDAEEALTAASSIGDDRLQKQARGYATPDSFTHGSSAQRVRWFRRGLETGDFGALMDLFETDDL